MELLSDTFFMQKALRQAQMAFDNDEVPVGCVIVSENQILAQTHNQTQMLVDVTAHAEILAITAAAQSLNSKYLHSCTLYVTLEPCVMCAGALRWSQIGRVVYGAADDKNGFMRLGKELLHPRTTLEFGIKHQECGQLIRDFFSKKRSDSRR